MNRKKRRLPIETVVVVCEGASENIYLQELNRFFRERRIPLVFVPKIIGSGVYKAAVNKYRDVLRESRNAEVVIWVDKDIYLSSQQKLYENKPENIPDFLFSRMNFEDFLVMHMDRRMVMGWQAVCEDHDHFSEPMCSSVYQPLYRVMCFPHYRKGKLPFKMNEEALQRLFANQKRKYVLIKSDFGIFLENRLQLVEQLMQD